MEATAIRKALRGATFVRADLHIHTFGEGGSYDVQDAKMTPEGVVQTAIQKSLHVVAITDHNCTGNVRRAIDAAKGAPLLVVPGVELSSPGGHFLAYAPTVEVLERIVGKLVFSEDQRACRNSVFDIVRVVEEHEGIVIAAHIDQADGFETAIAGYGDQKATLVCSRTLVALEIARASSRHLYTESDDNEARRDLLRRRIEGLGDPLIGTLPKVQASDAHTIDALGRNYEKQERLTRLKMAQLDWNSFVRAFRDPEARVRIEEDIPKSIPMFVGMHITGGFLDGQTFPFSPNLTCIIGGRGSGKSTAFHALRAAAGRPPPTDLAESEIWPEQIDIVCRDEFGAETHVRVGAQGDISNETDAFAPVPDIPFESLAQGDMARTIERCGEDPLALLRFLDELVDIREPLEEAGELQRLLRDNGDTITSLSTETAQLVTLRKTLAHKQQQEKAAREEKGAELVEQQAALGHARTMRDRLLPTFLSSFDQLKQAISTELLNDFGDLAETAAKVVGAPAENPLPAVLERLKRIIADAQLLLAEERVASEPLVRQFIARCQKAQSDIHTALERRVSDLRAKGVVLDLRALGILTTDIQQLQAREQRLLRQAKLLSDARAARAKLRREYAEARADASRLRQGLAAGLNEKLKDVLIEFHIKIHFEEARVSIEAEEALKQVMDWRTAAVPKAPALIRSLGVVALLQVLEDENVDILSTVKGPDGDTILDRPEAQAVVERFRTFENRRRLEDCAYEDLPRIVISKRLQDEHGKDMKGADGRPRYMVREFAHLSLGQQQAIILAILLCSQSTAPLLIDQPEDNLDSAFIFRVVVRALRTIKERRQVIIVTHNANIGVLSDSDLVVPLKATADKAVIVDAGSVETSKTRDLVCEVLEGGRAAYARRGRLYGL